MNTENPDILIFLPKILLTANKNLVNIKHDYRSYR